MRNNIQRLIFQSVLFLCISITTFSQSNSGLIKVIVSPDHKDRTYKTGEYHRGIPGMPEIR